MFLVALLHDTIAVASPTTMPSLTVSSRRPITSHAEIDRVACHLGAERCRRLTNAGPR